MTSSFRALHGRRVGLRRNRRDDLRAHVVARPCASPPGFGVSPFAGITTSHRIGRVFENAVKLMPYAGCTTLFERVDGLEQIAAGACTTPAVSSVIESGPDAGARSISRNNAVRSPVPWPSSTFRPPGRVRNGHAASDTAAVPSPARDHPPADTPSCAHRPVSMPMPSRLLLPASAFSSARRPGGVRHHGHVDARLIGNRVEARPATCPTRHDDGLRADVLGERSAFSLRLAWSPSVFEAIGQQRTSPMRLRMAAISSAVRVSKSMCLRQRRATAACWTPRRTSTIAASARTTVSRNVQAGAAEWRSSSSSAGRR